MRVQTRPRLLLGCLFAASVLALGGVAAAMTPAPLVAEAAGTPPSVALASMVTARAGHTAAYLNNGLVLVAGGRGQDGYLRSAELYDPNANVWIPAASMAVPRADHTATLLRDGRVLIVGGRNQGGPIATAELYDPGPDRWSSAGSTMTGRVGHSATFLPDGKVLVVGGQGPTGLLATAELFDPFTSSWSTARNMSQPRFQHTATLLDDGDVLVAGGFGPTGSLASAELYHPASNSWSLAASMQNDRALHTASLLPNGHVLVVDGESVEENVGTALAAVEVYDPHTNSWSPGPSLVPPRFGQAAITLCNGRVFVTGGVVPSSFARQYDVRANAWLPATPLLFERSTFTATLLRNCHLLIAGGSTTREPVASVEVINPSAIITAGAGTGSTILPPAPGWLLLSLLVLLIAAVGLILLRWRPTQTATARPFVVLGFQLSGIVIATWLLLSLARVPVAAPANAAGAARPHELQLLNQPEASVLAVTTFRSLGLIALALVWSSFLGLGIAVVKTSLRHRRFVAVGAAAGALWITPTFALAIFVQELQAFVAGHSALVIAAGFGDTNAIQVFWAAVVLGLRPAAYFFRHSEQVLELESTLDYVRTAQAKGLSWRRVVSRHMLRAAVLPLAATWSNSLRVMIGSLPLVEFFFGYPGLGRVLILSLGLSYTGHTGRVHGDLAMGLVVMMALILIALETAVSILQLRLDPRLRAIRAVA